MNSSKTVDEEGEVVKQWILRHGPSFFISLVLVLAVIFGYKQWEQFRADKLLDQSQRFKQIIKQAQIDFSLATEESEREFENLVINVGSLRSDYEDSDYAALAACILAAQAVELGDFDLAVSQLTYAESIFSENVFSSLAQIQLAQLEIGLGEPENALKRLEKLDSMSLQGTVNLLKGDAFVALNEPDKAKIAYEKSKVKADQVGIGSSVLALKLNDLPISLSE